MLKLSKQDSKFSQSSSYRFKQVPEDSVTADTTLTDPLDHRNVFIVPSGGGESCHPPITHVVRYKQHVDILLVDLLPVELVTE